MSGFVESINSKPTNGKNDLWSIKVDGDWFGHGFDEPNFDVGAEIEFEITMNGDYENVDVDTVVVLQEAPDRGRGKGSNRGSSRGGSKRGSSRGGSRGNGRGSSSRGNSSRGNSNRGSSRGSSRRSGTQKEEKTDWARKDNLIRLQSSQNTAIATIGMMVMHSLIALPKKKSEHMDAITALIEKEAKRLFDKYDDIADDIADGYYDRGAEGRQGAPEGNEEYDDDVPS